MACEADSNVDADAATLQALDSFITAQRALLARQLADVDRLQLLKASLEPQEQNHRDVLMQLTSTVAADKTFALSTHADVALKLPASFDWTTFAGCDPAPLRGLTHPAPVSKPPIVSELQALVRHAAITMLEPRMRRYPRVPTPSPPGSGDECSDPVAMRRAREHAKIRELRDVVRRGGSGGLRTMRMGVIKTDVGEDAMRGEVRIDDDDEERQAWGERHEGAGKGRGKGKMLGKGKTTAGARIPRQGKHYGKAVPASYLHADDNEGGAAPAYATKNLGLVAAHTSAASPMPDADACEDENMAVDSHPPVHLDSELDLERVPALKAKPKAKSKPKPKPKANQKSRANSGSMRVKKASYEYTDDESDAPDEDMDDDDDDELTYKDPSAFVPSVTVYPSSSSGEEENDTVHMDVDMSQDPDADLELEPTAKSRSKVKSKPSKRKPKKKKSVGDDTDAADSDDAASHTAPKAASTKGKAASKPTPKAKPRPATFNLPWSTEEQHHLEQLLEEIPATARFRWQQISRAMGGRRTPRQVASRVQKYFEKMKKWGL